MVLREKCYLKDHRVLETPGYPPPEFTFDPMNQRTPPARFRASVASITQIPKLVTRMSQDRVTLAIPHKEDTAHEA